MPQPKGIVTHPRLHDLGSPGDSMPRFRPLLLLVAGLCVATAPALAQGQQRPAQNPPQRAENGGDQERARSDEARRLPAEVSSEHTLDLPGRSLKFTATLGSVPLYEGEGGPLIAEVAVTMFRLKDADPAKRPVTFLFNGGPGAASGYLDLGAIGPWRLPLETIAPSASPVTVPNAETWLDFTDLIFVDPVGTGLSWGAGRGEDQKRRFFSVDADAQSLAVVIRKWLDREGRLASPKFLVGESYGGFRAPRIAAELRGSQGVGISGMLLLSPVLDFGWRFQNRHTPMRFVSELPSMAATAMANRGRLDREALRPVEAYASGEFLVDFLRGPNDGAAAERMSRRVAELTGLDYSYVRKLAGRVDAGTFAREANRQSGRVASLYDATVTGPDPYPVSPSSHYEDPVLDGSEAPLTSAMVSLNRMLGWKVDRAYKLLNHDVNRQWDWGSRRSSAQVLDSLRESLALDANLRVVVAHGMTDLVTPYFENQMLIAQLPDFGDRVRLALVPGGHMFYLRDDSRAALRNEGERLVGAGNGGGLR
jgi:carboxypeptidase C (cathepsin A)